MAADIPDWMDNPTHNNKAGTVEVTQFFRSLLPTLTIDSGWVWNKPCVRVIRYGGELVSSGRSGMAITEDSYAVYTDEYATMIYLTHGTLSILTESGCPGLFKHV